MVKFSLLPSQRWTLVTAHGPPRDLSRKENVALVHVCL